jgi:hypothetical protein
MLAPAATGSDAANCHHQTDPIAKIRRPGANYEAVIGIAKIVSNVKIGSHTHPGPESTLCGIAQGPWLRSYFARFRPTRICPPEVDRGFS